MIVWCFNRNVLIGLGIVALGVLALRPDAIGAVLPALVLLACPLSMVFMMRAMHRSDDRSDPPPAGATEPRDAGTDAEIVRLRAEIDQVRAELADKRHTERAE